MIISASYRTDIPAFYGDWFRRRWQAGYCRVPHPFTGRIERVSLAPQDVDGVVFWTRNGAPFLDVLDHLRESGVPFVLQYTCTGLTRPFEPFVPRPAAVLRTMRRIRRRYGADALVWRYDPIVISSRTPLSWHRERFATLAESLEGCCNEVIVSFTHIYRKTRRSLDLLEKSDRIRWRDPQPEEKRSLLRALVPIADHHGMRLNLCAQPDYRVPGAGEARCIDAERLSTIAQRVIACRAGGNRAGCRCDRSKDIGAYDSCPHGCRYCYAIHSAATAKRRYRRHDPSRDSLFD